MFPVISDGKTDVSATLNPDTPFKRNVLVNTMTVKNGELNDA